MATNQRPPTWEFWIDVGGTFTDCIARAPDGRLRRHKTLSSGVVKGTVGAAATRRQIVDTGRQLDPAGFWTGWSLRLVSPGGQTSQPVTVTEFDRERGLLELQDALAWAPTAGQGYELYSSLEAPLIAARYVLQLPMSQPLPPLVMRLGTTRGTNALLTRTGGKTAFVTTQGFGEILKIGHQARPRLFDLNIHKPEPLYTAVAEIEERVEYDGVPRIAPSETQIRQELSRLREHGIDSLAICLLNAHANGIHETQIAEIAAELGFADISVSHEVAPLIKLVDRGSTTVVNAYLNAVLQDYVQQLIESTGDDDFNEMHLMTSSGGLVRAGHFYGKDSILSGPAGGVVGFAKVAGAAGFQRAIGFDMGGTSTDVARYAGSFEREFENEKAGVRIFAPMLAIETVAAGGGSVCGFDGVKLFVGPQSAGADPGPACYGRGGPLTVTDINLWLGKVVPEQFPFSLNRQAVQCRLAELRQQIHEQTQALYTDVELAEGFLQVANANMAQAIRSVSIAKGYDPRDHVMVAFGGAAPQHACAVARELGIRQIINHPDAGILSALGVGHADVTRHAIRGLYRNLADLSGSEIVSVHEHLSQQAVRGVIADGIPLDRIETVASLDLRYSGTDSTLNVVPPPDGDYERAFTVLHEQRYGYTHPGRPVELVAARVEAIGKSGVQLRPTSRTTACTAPATTQHEMFFEAKPTLADCYQRSQLRPGQRISGPALIGEAMSTTIIDPGWVAEVLTEGELLITDEAQLRSPAVATDCDPATLEIFNRYFESIAEQMGITLRNTSSSVNVKERLDFSCAIFTDQGDLVVNAPHIPVHLGAMSETVRHILTEHQLQPGDVIITNDPYHGGSHLPDITVVTPIFDGGDQELRFLVASRAHHAEIGGVTPGSMPPFSTTLAEEGVLIRSFKVVDAGRSRLDELRQLLAAAPYPSRDVHSNLADISAQIAANQRGVGDLLQLIGRYSWPVVKAYMLHIQTAATAKMTTALSRLKDGEYRFEDHLDDGSRICATVSIKDGSAVIDFRGSSAAVPDNLNANRAIVTAATMYCLRCLIDEDIPLNEGVLEPIELIVPVGILAPTEGDGPESSPAVAGGNVETSQRIVDVLLGALGLAAASQGTMNNLLFGNDQFGYYETICGGAGATLAGAGADAVHTHMTNTRLTDPEVIERLYPIRVREFSIRPDSGGAGLHRGGNGVVRDLEFTAALQVSVLSQRRGPYAPYGLQGGQPGSCGQNEWVRADGRREQLPWRALLQVQPGDRLRISTPGGGGYGSDQNDQTE